MNNESTIYLDTPVALLLENGTIDKTVMRACQSAKPPMVLAGDIVEYLKRHGSFAGVPGCRRPGRIPDTLLRIANATQQSDTPTQFKPYSQKRQIAEKLEAEASFDFLTDEERENALRFRAEHGHLPMFAILRRYLLRDSASRNDTVMAYSLGMHDRDGLRLCLADIAERVGLSRERVRQIAITYNLPENLAHTRLWAGYADHSAYYADAGNAAYRHVREAEVPGLSFAAYASVLHRTTMMHNVEDTFLARRGWVEQISAWVNRLKKLAAMPRAFDNRISLEGLAMGGKLDMRIVLVVLNQIAPALGLRADGQDALILPKNTE